MKALVTGATGFTGSALCARLVRDKWDVAAFVRSSSRREHLEKLGVCCSENDITDPESVRHTFPDVDVVFHVAAAYRAEHVDESIFERVNVDATRNMLVEAKRRGVRRFVHCSTVGVQGVIEHPPANEDYRLKPGDHYQSSKLAGEKLALEFSGSGLEVVIVRPVGIYGPGDMRFLKMFRGVSKGYFFMIGSGETLYHMTYIDDLVDGIVRAATRPEAAGEVFTIAGEKYTTLNDLVKLVADAVGVKRREIHIPLTPVMVAAVLCERVFRSIGKRPPLYPRRAEFFVLNRAFSIEKARRLLGYEPKVSLEEGLRRTADWYKSEGLI
jgi:nucleoside-diphosphate-sugar epimerase